MSVNGCKADEIAGKADIGPISWDAMRLAEIDAGLALGRLAEAEGK